MDDITNLQLQILCDRHNLDNRGGKETLIYRLRRAGVTDFDVKAVKPEEKKETRAATPKRGRPKKK
jgi:hypothetical protein